jgi:RNA polymerase sigma factor (sigma-70 family)
MSDGSLALRRPSRTSPALALLGDDRLAKLAAGGSTAAFSAIYKRHHQAIYRYCLSIVGNEHDARDALQDAMASALAALQGEEREISLKPWLFRIAHNEAITVLRKRKREAPVEEILLEAPDQDDAGRAEVRELVADLGLLTARQRSAIVMRELSGLSFDEIGAALEVSPEGAKQAVYEGRCALQEIREGRLLDCVEVRTKISANDRRMLRGRRVRAHLKACEGCREFADEIAHRRDRFAALAPLPAPAALGILQAILGGGSGGGGIAVGAGAGASAGMAGLAKLGVAGVIALGVGAGALEIRSRDGNDTSASAAERSAPATAAEPTTVSEPGTTTDIAASAKREGPEAKRNGNDGRGGDNGDRAGSGANSASGSHGQNAPGESGSQTSPTQTDDSAAAVSDTNNGNGPASTPPGQGGTPPGQGGVPPGLGTEPPGHGGTPPGQSTTSSPGSSGQAPGQTGQTPASGASPPSQAPDVAPPGNSGQAPGHGATPPGQSGDDG